MTTERPDVRAVIEGFAHAWAHPDLDRFMALLHPEREADYDSLKFMLAVVGRPSAWPGYWRYRGYVPG